MATSNKVYYLRNRRTAQATPKARKQQRSRAVKPSGASPFNSPLTPLPDDTPSIKRESSSPIRLFSQVAAPSPVVTGAASPSVRSEDGTAGFVTPFITSPIGSDASGSDVSSSVPGDGSDVPFKEEDTNPTPWKVVQYGRRKRTFSPVLNTPNLSQFSGSTVTRVRKQMHASINTSKNIGEQDTPISAAKAKLTLAEQELLRKRSEAVVIIDDTGIESSWETDSASRGEGPSSGKGKGIDPGNWGAKDKSKALQQAYDEQKKLTKKRSTPAPPPTPVKSAQEPSRQPSVEASSPKPEIPSPLLSQPVFVPFETSPVLLRTPSVVPGTSSPKPGSNEKKNPKRPSVVLEEVMDEDEIEYLVRKAKLPSDSKTLMEEIPVKPKSKNHQGSEQRSSSARLSGLMEQQIEQIVHHPSKSKKSKSAKVPKKFVSPTDQIDPDSHLGKALNQRVTIAMGGDPPSDSSKSSSSSSQGSESDFSKDESGVGSRNSSGSEEDGYLITANRSLRRRRSQEKNRTHRPKRKMILKPVPPAKYNGEADSRQFLKFLNDGTAYVREGGVPRREHVRKLGAFLTGEAADFYEDLVEDNAREWRLTSFFKELYNYCFPLTYRMEQRRKLKKCFQNELTVKQYDAALRRLWNTIGITSERERVDRLWTGLRVEIQKGLWQEKLHPEFSRYKDVLRAAELTEVIESIDKLRGGTRNKPQKSDHPQPSGNQAGGSHNHRRSHSPKTHFKKKRPFGKMNNGHRHASGSRPEKYSGNSPHKDSRPKRKELSEQEKARFKSEGLCYRCGKTGHMARQCPDGKNVSSDRKNNPPGFSSSNVNFENLRGLADTTEDLHELKVGMMRWPDNDESVSDENGEEDDCPDLQTVSASSESESEDTESSAWPYCDDDEFPFREEKSSSSEWVTVVSASENTSQSSRHDYHECIGCHSLEWCDAESNNESEKTRTRIPYQVLFNAVWDCLDLEALDVDGAVDVSSVREMLLDSVVRYLIAMDTGEDSPPDSLRENEELAGILDYLVAETGVRLDPIPEAVEHYDNDGEGWSDRSEDIESWRREVESSEDDDLDLDLVPLLLASPPHGEDEDAEPVINIWNISLRHGLTSIEPGQIWYRNDEELGTPPPIQLLPFVPRESIDPEARRGLWYYSELSNDYPRSFEEKFSFIQSYGHKESCRPHSFGDSVAQNAQWVLDYHGPYPGDHPSVLNDRCDILSPWGRFHVERYSDTHHLIMDKRYQGTHLPCETLIWTDWLEKENFPLAMWYAQERSVIAGIPSSDWPALSHWVSSGKMRAPFEFEVKNYLANRWFPGDQDFDPSGWKGSEEGRFRIIDFCDTPDDWPHARCEPPDYGDEWVILEDKHRKRFEVLSRSLLRKFHFDLDRWYSTRLAHEYRDANTFDVWANNEDPDDPDTVWGHLLEVMNEMDAKLAASCLRAEDVRIRSNAQQQFFECLELNATQARRGDFSAVQRNSANVRDARRKIPRTLVIVVKINGHPCRALIDTGSMGDFISTTIVDQLGLKCIVLAVPLPLQMAVQGSRSKINCGVRCELEYQTVKGERYFDVANLSSYDVILGTPWLYQHEVTVGFNSSRVIIGSITPRPMQGPAVGVLESRATVIYEESLAGFREELIEYARPLFKKAAETPLPPLRAINHQIPLIDPDKVYPWRLSRCPEMFREQWDAKRKAYIETGRWKVTTASNTVPMLLIKKPSSVLLRTVVDLRARNANTRKMASPLPDIDGILRRVACAKYFSLMDSSDAYEQVRVDPAHVDRTAVSMPDGNMLSLVMQQGDCNAPATFQAIMNHIFSPYIGRFMDVYLDDIIVYSNTLKDHLEQVRLIIDILKKEKFYLGENKVHFLAKELKVLGRIVDHHGIRMDPKKVDAILKWPTPTNKDLLLSFLGSLGWLADDIAKVRIPMGQLSALTGSTTPFHWTYSEQRAFEETKALASACRSNHRVPIDYTKGAKPVWLVSDGCGTGIAAYIIQGETWDRGAVCAFYSAKLNPAQQNYPVHEIEMLAGVECMLHHRDILQGLHFTWVTDHKGLIHLSNQKILSGRQARWMEKLGEFDFKVQYVPGAQNILADALSCLWSNEALGTVRGRGVYTYHDVIDNDSIETHGVSMPVLVGVEAACLIPEGVGLDLNAMSLRTSRQASARARGLDNEIVPGKLGQQKTSASSRGRRNEGEGVKDAPKPKPKPSKFKPNLPEPHSQLLPENEAFEHANAQDELEVKAQDETKLAEAKSSSSIEHQVPRTRPHVEDENSSSNTSLIDVLANGLPKIDLAFVLRDRYAGDTLFQKILAKPKDFRNFEHRNGLIFLKLEDRELLCIPDYVHKGRSIKEIVIDEGHSLLAHLGTRKTLAYLRDHVWWKSIARDVETYCKSCVTCKRTKDNTQKPYGLLHPLMPPTYPWEIIGIDFIDFLPESSNRDGTFDMLTVIIDKLTGMVHLVPSRMNYKAKEVAELIFEEVYKLHGLPKGIVSDRDTLFTSIFWSHLHKLIGTKLKMSSTYHPETDGSTEWANRVIGAMLRQCISADQKNWVALLPVIEFAINSARSEITGYAPFFLNNGRMPRSMIWDNAAKTEYPGVRVFAMWMKQAILSASILESRVKQTWDANRKRRPIPFTEKDLVYISTKNISFLKGLACKLNPKYIGPYSILKDFGNGSFRIALPSHLKARGVHDVFHASLLRIHVPNDDRLFPGRAENQVGLTDEVSGEWAVEQIVGHSGSRTDSLFQVKWKSGDVTWLPYEKADHLDALGEYFDALGISDVSQLRDGRAPPPEDDEYAVEEVSEVRVSAIELLSVGKISSVGWATKSNGTKPTTTHLNSQFSLSASLSPSTIPSHPSIPAFPLIMPPSLAPIDNRLAIIGLNAYNPGLWTVNDREESTKFLTNSESIHMCILLSERARTGAFDICRDPIPAIYFPLARIFNNSAIEMDYPQRMVWLPPDRVASKVVIEGEPVLFEHFFHDEDEYSKKIRGDPSGVADDKFDTISTYIFEQIGMKGMSLADAKLYIHQLRQASKRQAKFEESWNKRQAEKHFMESTGSKPSGSKKQKTRATPGIKGFDGAFMRPAKPRPKGWKNMTLVQKVAAAEAEEAAAAAEDEEMVDEIKGDASAGAVQ
ncbi:uncharacterized protein ARMOST_16064 [Armillaria ostoyae]|uniref:RNA-directed DNA polymerase n=1 Tax=Armillaria ostoyae TaxID=47428 RepID=A0A284RV89_ARMOS|nr:uncharacterized protein ARMOST_16064 [Armillaria ostoyae]